MDNTGQGEIWTAFDFEEPQLQLFIDDEINVESAVVNFVLVMRCIKCYNLQSKGFTQSICRSPFAVVTWLFLTCTVE